jgi:hypothetical protein
VRPVGAGCQAWPVTLTLAEQAGEKGAEAFLQFHALTSKFTADEIDEGRKRANEWLKEQE